MKRVTGYMDVWILKLERDGRPCPIIAFVAWGVFFEKNQTCFPWMGSKSSPDDEVPGLLGSVLCWAKGSHLLGIIESVAEACGCSARRLRGYDKMA